MAASNFDEYGPTVQVSAWPTRSWWGRIEAVKAPLSPVFASRAAGQYCLENTGSGVVYVGTGTSESAADIAASLDSTSIALAAGEVRIISRADGLFFSVRGAAGTLVNVTPGRATNTATETVIYDFGDSFAARGWYTQNTGAFVSAIGRQATWALTGTGQFVPAGSKVRIGRHTGANAALSGECVVVDHNATQIVLEYPVSVNGLTGITGTAISFQSLRGDTCMMNYAEMLLRMQGRPVRAINLGTSGDDAEEMMERIQHVPNGALVALRHSTNDAVAVAAANYSLDTAMANASTLIDALLAKGCVLHLMGPVPLASLTTASDTVYISYCNGLRNLHRRYAMRYPATVRHIDLWDTLRNPGDQFVQAAYTMDGTHPSPNGALVAARKYVADTLDTWPRGSITPLSTTAPDSNNFVLNPRLSGTGGTLGGGCTGVAPDNVTVTRTGGAVVSAVVGEDLEMSYSPVSAATCWAEFAVNSAPLLGKTVVFALDFELMSESADMTHYVLPGFTFDHNGQTRHVIAARNQATFANNGRWPKGSRVRFQTEPVKIPDSGVTNFVCITRFTSGAAGTAVFRVSAPALGIVA